MGRAQYGTHVHASNQFTGMIPWIGPHDPFPPVESALLDPNGLLAASHQLHAHQLIDAYRHGIFPWYSENEPIVWWSPDPRLVLRPEAFVVSRSLKKRIHQLCAQTQTHVVLNRNFAEVMRQCAAPRAKQHGTWITPQVMRAYGQLHAQGLAHSVEVWNHDELVGGLYGVALGRMFYGESMFARQSDASKIALSALVLICKAQAVALIDCQQETAHLKSLGAQIMSRSAFCTHVRAATEQDPIDWKAYTGRDLKPLLTVF